MVLAFMSENNERLSDHIFNFSQVKVMADNKLRYLGENTYTTFRSSLTGGAVYFQQKNVANALTVTRSKCDTSPKI